MKNLWLIFFLWAVCHSAYSQSSAGFQAAEPVWLEGRAQEMNLSAGFRAPFAAGQDDPVVLRIAGATIYKIWLNGEFLGFGPARGPHGFYRVDEWQLQGRLKNGENLIAIEVAGYNCNSYYLLDQPSFLQAEIVCDGRVLAATGSGENRFEAKELVERVQKVQRYSFQRPFVEVYRLGPDSHNWRTDQNAALPETPIEVVEEKKLIHRGVPYPDFVRRPAVRLIARGKLQQKSGDIKFWGDRSLHRIGPKLKGFPPDQLEFISSRELDRFENSSVERSDQDLSPNDVLKMASRDFDILDLGQNLTGFIGLDIQCQSPTRLLVSFDELLSDGDVNYHRLGCASIVTWELEPGSYRLESMEPYTMRFIKLNLLAGKCTISNAYLREYTYPNVHQAHFASSDPDLNLLFRTGRETFRQNTVDIFMDCPSRERAGWLCDSYFTARVAFDLSGRTDVERNFFENFLLPARFDSIPEGMLPMCYPADHYDGVFIPNWALWFVVQLREYAARSGDLELVSALEPKVRKLFDYFRPFENSDGLLENLESWVFVEWSEANKFVQDVNYPTNMLYAAALESAGFLYNDDELIDKAASLRHTVLDQSFDGTFFQDNAVRNNGILEVTENKTEVCQYFAFYFNVASPQDQPELWQKLLTKFGPVRKHHDEFPDVYKANAFVGNYLRMELLARYGQVAQMVKESKDFFLPMAHITGTFWENMNPRASCNHGFASHVSHTLVRDVLGLKTIDPVNKQITIRFSRLAIEWCEGELPTKDGPVLLRWQQEHDRLAWSAQVPFGYQLQIENDTGLNLVRLPETKSHE